VSLSRSWPKSSGCSPRKSAFSGKSAPGRTGLAMPCGGLKRELQNSKKHLLTCGSEWRLHVCGSLPSRDGKGVEAGAYGERPAFCAHARSGDPTKQASIEKAHERLCRRVGGGAMESMNWGRSSTETGTALRATKSDEKPKLWGGRPRPRLDPQVRPAEPGGSAAGQGTRPTIGFSTERLVCLIWQLPRKSVPTKGIASRPDSEFTASLQSAAGGQRMKP
jgi:hypothetical protein